MYQTQVTIVGNLLTDVDCHRLNDGTVVANFRVASKERRFDRSAGTWVDGDRLFVDVQCWRGLAVNAAESLKKGDPVVVAGRIFTRNYEHQGQRRTSITVDARSVAADLASCTVVLTRARRASGENGDAGDEGRTAGAGGGRVDEHGRWPAAGEAPLDGGGATQAGPDDSYPELVGVAPGDEG